ncbi:MAG TPA: PKD domain-containing protein [Bacteroidetes bacterium]|nr:PKD domain-containing protein [Bacteroidota bacterium]
MKRFVHAIYLLFIIPHFVFSASPIEGESYHPRKSAPADATPYLKFAKNEGQWEGDFRYRTDLIGGRLWLQDNGFTYAFQDVGMLNAIHDRYYHEDDFPRNSRIENEKIDCHAFKVEFVGANTHPQLSTSDPSPTAYNYFLGKSEANWSTDQRVFSKVHYTDLYPGIGLDVYSKDQNLKYDFILGAGADPNLIQLKYDGLQALFLKDGNLHLHTSVNKLVELKPFAYQIIEGELLEIPSQFELKGNVLSFIFPRGYNTNLPLIIDPTLVGATYSGSTATCFGHSATYDDIGNIYAAGICFGQGFPVSTGAFQVTFGGATDMAINKYNPDATSLIWSTYIGGSNSDYPHSMIVNHVGELIILGSTGSNNFPLTAGAYDNIFAGISEISISHLSSNATSMIGSTFLGGSMADGRNGGALTMNYGDTYRGEVIVDDLDNIYIASATNSNDVPLTTGSFQPAFGGGNSDGIVAKFNPLLTTMLWGSYLGGTAEETSNSLKINSLGEVYVTGGTTSSLGFPVTSGAFHNAILGQNDAYLLHINSTGTTVMQGTYLGTAGDDQGYFVEIDVNDNPYVLGQAASYPVSSGVYAQANGGLFIDKLLPNLSGSQLSTTLGDAIAGLSPTAFLVDVCGNIYASAWGNTQNLPTTTNAFQPIGGDDFYLAVLQPNASGLLYATNFGGSGWEHVDGGTSRFDKAGIVYEASCSNSTNWPVTTGAVYSNSTTLGWDVVCFKFEFSFVGISAAFAAAQAPSGCAPYTVNFVNSSSQSATTTYFWDFGTGDVSTLYSPTYVYTTAGTYNVTLIATDSSSCAGADTAYLQVIITELPPLTLDQDTTVCFGDSVQLHSVILAGATYSWSPPAGLSNPNIHNPLAQPNVTTSYTLTLTDSNGCVTTGQINLEIIKILSDAGPLVAFCEGEGGTQLTAGPVSGGSSPYYYTWWCDTLATAFCGLDSVNDDDPIANPDTTAWYYLQVQDAHGCLSEIDSALVQVLPKPIVDAGPDVGICQPPAPGSVLHATVLNSGDAPGPYTIQWLPSAGLNDPTIFSPHARPDTTTIYTAVVTSANGCTSEYTTVDTTSTITVTVHPQPIADAGPDIHGCLGDSSVLQGQGFGAGPNYTYEWSPNAGLSDSSIANPTGSPAFTHTYILNVWSNGCPSIGDTMTLWMHTLPTPSAGPIREICLGESVQLDAFGAGDSSAYYTYQWWPAASLDDPTAENPLAKPDTTTQYHLVVTSSWGCDSPLDSVQVTVKATPQAEAGPNLELCAGDSVLLQGSYYYTSTDSADPSQIYYHWAPNQNLDDPSLAQATVWPDQSGWYYLDVSHNTCQTQDSVFLTVIPTNFPTVGADTNVTCEGDSVALYANGGLGGAVFTWIPALGLDDPNATHPMAAPGQTTTYVLVMEEGGCTTLGEVTLEVLPKPAVAYLSSGVQGCAPFAVSFLDNSSDVIQYIWDFGDSSPVSNENAPTHVYAQAGSYAVTLTGVNTGGCAAEAQSVLVNVVDTISAEFLMAPHAQPTATGAPVELFMPENTVNFTDQSSAATVSWRWDFGDGQSSQRQHPEHIFREAGVYMVTMYAANEEGCVSKVVHGPVIVKAPDLFIPNVFTPNSDNNNDRFVIEYEGNQPFVLQIFDRWGVLLYESQNKMQGWSGINLDGLAVADGVYYYALQVGSKEYAGPVTLVR